MAGSRPQHLVVGYVAKAHGIRGDVVVQPLTDHPAGAFAPEVALLLAGEDGNRPDHRAEPLRVESARPYRRGWLVRFAGVDDRDGAEALRGRYLLRSIDDVEPLAEGEVFYHDLLGLSVETVQGEVIGTVEEVYEVRPADLLEVATGRGSVLIPFLSEMVVEVRLDDRRMVVDPPEGLLDL